MKVFLFVAVLVRHLRTGRTRTAARAGSGAASAAEGLQQHILLVQRDLP